MAKSGFEIYKVFYPMPERFRLSDPVLVREVTGMAWPDFLAASERMEVEEEVDQIVLYGMAAVAFWQGNPLMSREKIRRTLERVWQDDLELIAGDEEEADVGPPPEGGVTPPSPPTESNGSPAGSSEPLSLSSSGSHGLPTGSPA
jgi:hypothetical protein